MPKIVIVRHGQTSHNRLGLIQGRTDTDLNEEGEIQARELAKSFASEKFDIVYSSPMKRALRTAQIVTEGRGLAIVVDDRLIEIDQGDWTHQKASDLIKNDERYKQWVMDPTLAGPPNGETIQDVAARAKSFIDDARGENVLVVAHGGLIAALVAVIKETPLNEAWKYLPKNTQAIFLESDKLREK